MPRNRQRTEYLRWAFKRRKGPKGDGGEQGDVGATGATGADSIVPGPMGPAGPGLKTFRASGVTDASGNVTFNLTAAGFPAAPMIAHAVATSATGAIDVRITALTATSCTVNVRQSSGIAVALLGLTLLGLPAPLAGATVWIVAAPAGWQS